MGTLGVDRDEAGRLLELSGGHVKIAIVMSLMGVDMHEAQRRLHAAGGSIADVVGDLHSS